MGTRSLIARRTQDGYEAVFCHFDGYPTHHVRILTGHYADEAALAALQDLGDLSMPGSRSRSFRKGIDGFSPSIWITHLC